MCFPEAHCAEQDHVGLVVDKLQAEQVLNLKAIDLARPSSLEGLQGFDDGEAGQSDATLNGALLTIKGFALNQCEQIVHMPPVGLRRFAGQRLEVLVDKRKLQINPAALRYMKAQGLPADTTPRIASSRRTLARRGGGGRALTRPWHHPFPPYPHRHRRRLDRQSSRTRIPTGTGHHQ